LDDLSYWSLVLLIVLLIILPTLRCHLPALHFLIPSNFLRSILPYPTLASVISCRILSFPALPFYTLSLPYPYKYQSSLLSLSLSLCLCPYPPAHAKPSSVMHGETKDSTIGEHTHHITQPLRLFLPLSPHASHRMRANSPCPSPSRFPVPPPILVFPLLIPSSASSPHLLTPCCPLSLPSLFRCCHLSRLLL
jgi:hypothetical protein